MLLAPAAAADSIAASDSTLEAQRSAFRAVYPEVERGNWDPVVQDEALLRNYVLWPDLQAAYLRAYVGAGKSTEIEAFLHRYGTLKPARELRYRYALQLGEDGRAAEFLEIYRSFYQGLEVAKLDCIALHAEITEGERERIVNRALHLWLVGHSQEDECDPVFDYLRGAGLLGEAEYRRRFQLAIEERSFSLARYLARSLDENYLEQAGDWLLAQRRPGEFIESRGDSRDTALLRRQLAYAARRIALADPAAAAEAWRGLEDGFAFDQQSHARTERHIALWAARKDAPGALALMRALDAATKDEEVVRWQIRTALRHGDWPAVLASVDELPDTERGSEQWRYWRAVALREAARRDEAVELLTELAGTRSYYGFLAADELEVPYAYTHSGFESDESTLATLADDAAFVRARELYLVGLDGRGRSEWDAAVRLLADVEKLQASILAHRWGWHSRAIATAASAGELDDLTIRYPLPWRDAFERYASAASIPHSWAYGVARSESLFMRDVQSVAGAIGIMQLLPETGRRTARRMQVGYQGRHTLTDPASNIRLGTSYLGMMFDRFEQNRVLATAAYNAGPLRVEDWLPERDAMDARIWIENIPYDETRRYVRQVLAADSIFHWRMTGDIRRISDELPAVRSAGDMRRVASSQ